jgi:hypothetical protein
MSEPKTLTPWQTSFHCGQKYPRPQSFLTGSIFRIELIDSATYIQQL